VPEYGIHQPIERAMRRYHNPVEIRFGAGALGGIAELVGDRPYCLVTYPDPPFDRMTARVLDLAGPANLVLDRVEANPDVRGLNDLCSRFTAAPGTAVIVALGGGSAIDTAKALAAARGDYQALRRALEPGQMPAGPAALPVIAVPTTAGTGSEVTSFAVIWDQARGRKLSLDRPDLFPEVALVDPDLTLGAPAPLAVATGLDALSHALESLWNRNANPISSSLAVTAAREIIEVLPARIAAPEDPEPATRMSRAALLAGLAFSNTRTTLAHAISYELSLRLGLAHGIACSFSLPRLLAWSLGHDAACDDAMRQIFGSDPRAGVDRLADLLQGLAVSTDPADYGLDDAAWRRAVTAAHDGAQGRAYIGVPTFD
jgi:alcohol dehydrogenase